MRFPEAVNACLNRYAQFTGRARRSEYWYFALFTVIVGMVTATLDAALFPNSLAGPINAIASLLLLAPALAAAARRLHDTDRSGWWMLVGLVPLVGWLFMLVWLCKPGTAGPNRFGTAPLGTSVPAGAPQPPG